jgi:uncharacterized protein YdeI (YjbR/CyaY-like superfamily)
MNPKVDGYLSKAKKWQEEMEKLRMILPDCGLTEELKWGEPCYTFQKSNIIIIIPLKEYCALMFCILYFSAPKQSKTRESRVEKCMQQILNGKGLNDQ